jgi:hypothetical protein
MSGLLELQMLAATRPGMDEPIECTTAWYRAKARVLTEEALVAELRGRDADAQRLRSLARGAHHHAETLALAVEAGHPIPSARTAIDEVI